MRWRDIPSQIIVRQGRRRAKVLLTPRFQNAIDRAAMRAKKRSADAYISEWEREPITPDTDVASTDLQAVADRLADQIETAYSDERLLALIRNHGLQDPPAGNRQSAGET